MERYKVTQQFIDDLNKWEYKTSWNFEDAFNFTTMPQSVIDYWFDDHKFHLERFVDVLQYLEHTAQQGNNTLNPFIIVPEEQEDAKDNTEYAYVVYEEVDVDGGFGDAIPTRETCAVFLDEQLANDYVAKYSNPKIYDSPYQNLYMGGLDYEKIPISKYIQEGKNNK